MQPLLDSFEALKGHFVDDQESMKIVEREAGRAAEWIHEHMPDDSDEKPRRKLGKVTAADAPGGERSIFDDVDL